MNVEQRMDRVLDALLDALIEEGKEALPISHIAARIGCTPTQTGYACDQFYSIDRGWRRIVPTDVYIDVHERNFNTVTHQRRCRGYKLTPQYLGSIIKTLKENNHG